MKIIFQQWARDPKTDAWLFCLRGRVSFEVKQVITRADQLSLRDETKAAVEREAYAMLREAFGQDAEREPDETA